MSLIYPNLDEFGIHRIWDSGDVSLQPIELNDINENFVDDVTDEFELIEEYGPHYKTFIILDKIKEFDRDFKYYRSLVSTNLEVFFDDLPKRIGDSLIEVDVDPDISNWRKLDSYKMENIIEELVEKFRMR